MTRHLLVIGAQRCGTTYLHAMLEAHPDITMARPARPEPKVFLSAEDAARGADWYRSCYFAHAAGEAVLGEKSTSYIEHPKAAVRAADMLGRAEIVVMLRDPLGRAVSNWRFSTASGLEDRPLREALMDSLRGPREWDPTATSVSPYAYLERGRYDEYLDPWYASFPHTMHVLFFEDLVGYPDAIRSLYATLGVDPAFVPEMAHEQVNRSDGSPPSLEPAEISRLREYFADSDRALSGRLGRALPWS